MDAPITRPHRPSREPLRVFVIVLVLVSIVEYLIMIALGALPAHSRSPEREALIDSLTLTAVLAPALWLLVARPLQRLSAARGELLGRLFEAQELERARLARDLHDELGQHLTAILIGLKTVDHATDLAQAQARARSTGQAAAASLDQVRRLARGLRPAVLEDLGLRPALERLCEDFRAAHAVPLELTVTAAPPDRLPAQVELCLYRVLQESLTNVARHASAGAVRVTLDHGPGHVSLTIVDDGRGFEPRDLASTSLGLHGLRERVELLHGACDVRSSAGRGTIITVSIPLPGSAT